MAGRIRTIKPELLSDAKTAGLSDGAFRLFVGLILLVDDRGRTPADVRYLTAQVFWGAPDGSTQSRAEVTRARQELAAASLVTLYTVRGQDYAAIRSWTKHQRIDKPGPSKCPAPEEAEAPAPTVAPAALPPVDSGNAREAPAATSTPVANVPGTFQERSENVPGTFQEHSWTDREGEREEEKDQIPPNPPLRGGNGVGQAPTQQTEIPRNEPSEPKAPTRGRPRTEPSEQVLAVFEHWRSVMGKGARAVLNTPRRRAIAGRLAENYSVAELKHAVDGCKASPHHQGENPGGTIYDDIELICRDQQHVDRFMANAGELVDNVVRIGSARPAPAVRPAPPPSKPAAQTPEQQAESKRILRQTIDTLATMKVAQAKKAAGTA